MSFPETRLRRLRRTETLRRMVRETRLSRDDLILPLFAVEGSGVQEPVASMPGVFRRSVDLLVTEAKRVRDAGIPAVLLFGIPADKDASGSGADAPGGIVQRAVEAVKAAEPDLCVITDVCLCEYTDHGHCGLIEEGKVANDPTLDEPLLLWQPHISLLSLSSSGQLPMMGNHVRSCLLARSDLYFRHNLLPVPLQLKHSLYVLESSLPVPSHSSHKL